MEHSLHASIPYLNTRIDLVLSSHGFGLIKKLLILTLFLLFWRKTFGAVDIEEGFCLVGTAELL
jgi:hypothetical protein